ncbi:MAG TPA: UDP-N-acetylmuramoyl-L-alanine--D-glutamate ligase [bacterium]|nr:UDP-N-acetylmuramoyl-L-alanine--D-glutamate ligase [bacterium]
MNLKGKKVLVVGFGKTGEALCDFLLTCKARVTVSEIRDNEDLSKRIIPWRKRGITFESGSHELKTFLGSDIIVTSPGVPPLPHFREAKTKGIQVISEIELAYRFLHGKIIGITGSNGKSTTTTLIHKILKEAGLSSKIAGNIGHPLISFVEESREDDWYVTELSSFQLEHIINFQAAISVFLNLSPDHLDWHSSFDDYFRAKTKLITAQKSDDFAVLNRDDPKIWSLSTSGNFNVFPFSRKQTLTYGCYLEKDRIILAGEKSRKLMKVTDIPLKGSHNQENVMAAAGVAHVLNIPLNSIKKSVLNFKALEHRLEKVLTLKGIEFFNDSKATNVDAAITALKSFNQKLILILGGRDKGGDFTTLKDLVRNKVKKIILIGEAAPLIRKALNKTVPMEDAGSLQGAVEQGFKAASPGDVVLLAPACTSFDMFRNFEERGHIFKHTVFALKEKISVKED